MLGLNINFWYIKMKRVSFITLITIMIFATVTTSCSDDFVDRPVQYSIDSENYFNSKSDYENALIATYDLLNSTFINVLMER
jgi:hypothetical protein